MIVAFEVMHHMRRDKCGGDGEVALKLDIIKAYDRVHWGYLRNRMCGLGFCEEWIIWVMKCVTTVTYNICLNGKLIGPIFPKRGLRQGDPLSLYLFLLCVKGLSDALNEANSDGKIRGCRVSSNGP